MSADAVLADVAPRAAPHREEILARFRALIREDSASGDEARAALGLRWEATSFGRRLVGVDLV